MSRLLVALSIAAALPALAGCVSAVQAHCDLRDGTWSCSGDVGGITPPVETPGL